MSDSDFTVFTSRKNIRKVNKQNIENAKNEKIKEIEQIEKNRVINIIKGLSVDEVAVKLTIDYHDEDHDGYCSGSGIEYRARYTKTEIVVRKHNDLKYIDDELDTIQFDSRELRNPDNPSFHEYVGCASMRKSIDAPSRTGYCLCQCTRKVVEAAILSIGQLTN
jgi:hypothetical protein